MKYLLLLSVCLLLTIGIDGVDVKDKPELIQNLNNYHQNPQCTNILQKTGTVLENLEEQETVELDQIAADVDQNCDDNGSHSSASPSHFKYSSKEQWSEWERLMKEAEDAYGETKAERLKCTQHFCDCYRFVIDKDLTIFANGISNDMINQARPRGVLYQILDGKLYRDEDCKFPTRCTGIEHFLFEIINELPNMEFVINVSDYPQIPNFLDMNKGAIPVFSFSKTSKYLDIFYPAWSFWDGGPSISIFPSGLGRWDLLRKSLLKVSKGKPWGQKTSQGFFRGSRTSAERDPLILVSRKYPHLVNAKYTKNQAWKSEADTLYAPAATEVKLEDHCQYKYLFNFRGVSASFRFKHLFLCESLVLHVGDEWEEFFYGVLKPWIHYIPISKDSTQEDLRSMLEFVQFHDSIAKNIATRGYKFIKSNLRLSHVTCYWKELLTKYAPLLQYTIGRRKDLVQIANQRRT